MNIKKTLKIIGIASAVFYTLYVIGDIEVKRRELEKKLRYEEQKFRIAHNTLMKAVDRMDIEELRRVYRDNDFEKNFERTIKNF